MENLKIQNIPKTVWLFVLSVVLYIISLNEGIFWDNITFASRMGNHLYEHGLFSFNIPIAFDPGHPPFLAFVQALGWKLLGHELWISHLMMLPFVFGFLFQLYIFIGRFVRENRYRIMAFFLILFDPTLSAEMISVSPEIIQMFFFFMAVNAIYAKKPVLKTIGLAFLGIVFFRGMMLCAGVFIFDISRHLWLNRQDVKSFLTKENILSYAIGSIPAVSYVIWRLATKGWLQSYPGSPWEQCWEMAGVGDFFRNVLVLGHRFADFGRVFILLFILIVLLVVRKSRNDKNIRELFLLAVSSVLVVSVVSLFSTNAFGHRYFISAFVSLILIAFIMALEHLKYKYLFYVFLMLSLITGNFWVYPERVAQGWSASLAHYPYFHLRQEAIEYIDDNNMEIDVFASFFPNNVIIDEVDLSGDMRKFADFNGNNPYVFYSNVYNLSDETYDFIEKDYEKIKTFEKGAVRIELLKRKEN